MLRKDSIFCPGAQRGHTSSGCGDLAYLRGVPQAGAHWNTESPREERLGFAGCVPGGVDALGSTKELSSKGFRRACSTEQLPSTLVGGESLAIAVAQLSRVVVHIK